MNQITFTVTSNHVSRGIPGDCFKCAAALALLDSGYEDVDISDGMVRVVYGGKMFFFEISNDLEAFIEDFDEGQFFTEDADPFKDRTFTLEEY